MGRKPRATNATLDVLEALLEPDQELYGLKIAKMIDRPTGSVFPILARLEDLGWVVSEWEQADPVSRGPRRRFYRLSPEGLAEARAMLDGRRTRRSPLSSDHPLAPRPGECL
ncbi:MULTISPECIES: PadR family transcriptional regulator [Actinosynnema]|uniref:PadR family transcriptional regulator n=1 Tax=Actinosynnema pretiosum TaxID=42197 RepID=A0A290ZBG0_9PSEU|nr:helix-turn-helix transcriptional regulator [Actinosynnema pretiosum]ATE56348.1 PadR family transcriptional regulator [Actinosynnema pretiosum]